MGCLLLKYGHGFLSDISSIFQLADAKKKDLKCNKSGRSVKQDGKREC